MGNDYNFLSINDILKQNDNNYTDLNDNDIYYNNSIINFDDLN